MLNGRSGAENGSRPMSAAGTVVVMRILVCRDDDLAVLDEHMPTPSATSFHAQRLARQAAGTSTYLIAWLDDRPVGVGEIRWDGCASPKVRAALPDCPEINGLHVVDSLQSRGIGTALIRTAEQLATDRAVRMIGLGVDEHDNPRAAALYERLGFKPVIGYLDCWSYVDEAGVDHVFEDPCIFLAKSLSPAPAPV